MVDSLSDASATEPESRADGAAEEEPASGPSISIAPSMSHFFHGAIVDAIRAREVAATEAAERYLVSLLVDFAHPSEDVDPTFSQPVTFMMRDAMEATGKERYRRLKAIGDSVLYMSGFFRQHAERGGVASKYLVHVGSSAYQRAADMVSANHSAAAPVFRELADKYVKFVEVIGDVSDKSMADNAKSEAALVKLYERWLDSGSSVLGAELGARGMMPVRPTEGLH